MLGTGDGHRPEFVVRMEVPGERHAAQAHGTPEERDQQRRPEADLVAGVDRTSATTIVAAPATAPAIPTARRGSRSVIAHHAPATARPSPARASTRKPRLRTTRPMRRPRRTSPHANAPRAQARSRQLIRLGGAFIASGTTRM